MADHSSSAISISAKLGSQAVGLITVLAISGSVALLTLGRQKLLYFRSNVLESGEKSGKDCELVCSQDFPSVHLFRPSCPASSEANCPQVAASLPSSLPNMTTSDTREEDGNLHRPDTIRSCLLHLPSVGSSCVPTSPRVELAGSTLNHGSVNTGEKRRSVQKKVRFSADVVEPSGNSQEYRWRARSGIPITRRADASDEGSSIVQAKLQYSSSNDARKGRISTSTNRSTFSNGYALEGAYQQAQDFARKSSPERRPHTVAKPKLPANRMALYNGMQQSRLQQRVL